MLLRDSAQQAHQGRPIDNLQEALPGDLAFFKNSTGGINHVGILLDGDRIIHASGRVHIDHINDEGILSLDTKIYTHHLSHIRRILTEG